MVSAYRLISQSAALQPTTKSRPLCKFSIKLVDRYAWNLTSTRTQYKKLGMETALTELDVRLLLPSTPELQATQATVYANSTKACLDVKGCVGVTVWDFWDPVSWVPSAFPGYGDATLFEASFKRKPAYYAVSDLLRSYA